MRQLPPVINDFIRARYGNTPVKVDTTPYWSTVRLQATIAGLIAAGGSRQAFAYGVGSDMALAGRAGVLATLADTNLQKSGETRQNADVFVTGIACYATQDSEPALLAKIFRECAVEITTDGVNTSPLACLEMLPAGGGLSGVGRSTLKSPSIPTLGGKDGGEGAETAFINNGNPMAGNFFMLDAPVLWTGQTGVDSNFRLNVTNSRAISAPAGTVRAAAAGVGGFTPPAVAGDDGTFVDLRFRLAVFAISKRSVNG